jgi:hypothetical protein
LRNVALSFSTIQKGDAAGHGAEGSVGIVVDFGKDTVVESVHYDDSGSGGLGSVPTLTNVAASIENRRTSNEWRVKNFIPVGIVILKPVRVRKAFILGDDLIPREVQHNAEAVNNGDQIVQEAHMNPTEVIDHFEDKRIFGVNDQDFLEFDHQSRSWKPVPYDEIISPYDCAEADPAPLGK